MGRYNFIKLCASIILINYIFIYGDSISPHGANFKIACEDCHTEKGWRVAVNEIKFDHSGTGFQLIGGHKKADCAGCHSSLKFNEVGVLCADCHTDIHRNELGNNCENCHTPLNWDNRNRSLDIHAATDFPLIGMHANLDCQSCHRNEQQREFGRLSTECSSCHLSSFQKTENPNHQLAGFELDCKQCHYNTQRNWQKANYRHVESFPLLSGHSGLACKDCHQTIYKGTNNACVNCHQTDYNSTTQPSHSKFQFPTVCERCHEPTVWTTAIFDHFTESGFQLEGAHATPQVGCISCHVNNQLTGLPQDCYGCHRTDFEKVSDPNHVTGHFPVTCEDCHNQNAFAPADFNHNDTNFPLTGAHASTECSGCHQNGYSNTPMECASCHLQDYQGTTDPDHAAQNFPQTCEDCHSTTAWTPASFDHSQTQFPLTGAHRSVDCSQCHGNGYSNTPMECVSCHQQDYDNTTNPAHAAAQFPTTCEDCHSTTAWEPAQFDHDGLYFPIYSGKHRNEWNQCADCHNNANDYKAFECINCHEHNQTEMNDKHREVNNYSYNSAACYDCHPQGKADD